MQKKKKYPADLRNEMGRVFKELRGKKIIFSQVIKIVDRNNKAVQEFLSRFSAFHSMPLCKILYRKLCDALRNYDMSCD